MDSMIFHEFNPVLYPVRLWIAITDNEEIIADAYLVGWIAECCEKVKNHK